MREFAKAFYLSSEWRKARAYVYARDDGLCVKCGGLGAIVHHKIPLSPKNICVPEIALGENNLELLCRDCHTLAHAQSQPIAAGLGFDEDGNIVQL